MAGKPETFAAKIRQCRICRDEPTGAMLPHEPRPVLQVGNAARVCISGQAPGTRVHASGIPFTDPSGDRLRDWMGVDTDIFYDTQKVAIIPMGFCCPGLDAKGSDLPPRKECAKHWHAQLFEAMGNISLLLLVGQYAQKFHLGALRHKTLTATVEHWRDYMKTDKGPVIIPLPHPSWRNNAWIKKNPWFSDDLLPVLRKNVREALGQS